MIISRMPALAIWIALVASLGTDVTASMSAPAIQGTASVIDGDTIEIRSQRIRLDAIDAPESSQLCLDAAGKRYRCGQKSAFALADMIGRSVVSCEPKGRDRYLIHCRRFHIDAERDFCSPPCGFSSVFRTYFENTVIDQEGENAIADIEYYGGVTHDTLRGFIKSSSDAMLQKRSLLLHLLCFLHRGNEEEHLDLATSSGEFGLFETTKSRILSEAFFSSKPDTVDEQIIAAFRKAASSM